MADEFLLLWICGYVLPVQPAQRSEEALRLAAACTADAARLGISLEALELAAGGNLATFMANAIDAAVAVEQTARR